MKISHNRLKKIIAEEIINTKKVNPQLAKLNDIFDLDRFKGQLQYAKNSIERALRDSSDAEYNTLRALESKIDSLLSELNR